MAVSYDKLFHKLINDKISTTMLRQKAGISANIITRSKRDEYISLETIESICKALNCNVDDILDFTYAPSEEEGGINEVL